MVKINSVSSILNKLIYSINQKESFGLIRFGDGGLKLIDAYLNSDFEQLEKISEKEGIPSELFSKIIESWKVSANICDYIDCPEVYFSGRFWKRTRRKGREISLETRKKLKNWEELYNNVGITNSNYCNPEVNFLMCLTSQKPSLLDIIKDKKVCCISNYSSLINVITNCDLEILQIPGFHENQYTHFSSVLDFINKHANDYDLWLVSAGELGRIFPGFIKFKGGRALDIGSLVDYWCTEKVPVRLRPYMYSARGNKLKLTLNKEGKKYKDFL